MTNSKKRPAAPRCSATLRGALLCATLALPFTVKAGMAEDAIAAAQDLYVRMSAKDLEGFLKYRPEDGFTEFTPGSKRLERLEQKPFADLFNSDRRISLRTEDLSARVVGDVAIVTGLRVGYVSPTPAAADDVSYGLTMVWRPVNGQMKLLHLHYSPLAK